MRVTELNIYPLKSARGIPLSESAVSAEGLPGDRRAMLVDPSGHFITQRELPAIATVLARHEDESMLLSRGEDGEV
ncbi:MOSC N-terminal beta barrel domain-containing protein, partial [Agrobacterium sp. ST15.16.024]